MISIPALVLTAGWVVLVAVILVLFGRTAGGAWSIASSVARGVRDWSTTKDPASRVVQTSNPLDSTSRSPSAEVDDRGERPIS